MAPSLSELLERFRPAGAPGAPGRGRGEEPEDLRARELADVLAILERFDTEAAAIVAGAEREAADRVAEAARRAGVIRAELPDLLAQAAAGGGADDRDGSAPADGGTVAGIEAEAERTMEGLRRAAADDLPGMAAAVAAHVLDTVLDTGRGTALDTGDDPDPGEGTDGPDTGPDDDPERHRSRP
jgi:hypothetical protein